MAKDAIVIGSGPNGLVAANLLADAGWSVLVVEANAEPGGAVRTGEIAAPGYASDLFSAFFPFAAASPVLARLGLEHHGLRWCHADAVLAHARPDEPAAVLERTAAATAAGLEADAAGDGDAWLSLFEPWRRAGRQLLSALLAPLPPVVPALRTAAALGPRSGLELVRLGLVPVRRLGEERFAGEAGRLLLAGCAGHTDLPADGAGSGLLGWLLAALGQDVGFPVPAGGAGRLTEALVRRLHSRGGELRCGARVDEVVVQGGRAVGVRLADGEELPVERAVLADVDAVALYTHLLADALLPASVLQRVPRIQPGPATVKVDWALDGPIPWKDEAISRAGAVHVADSVGEIATALHQTAGGEVPARPFLVLGQMAAADPSRAPAGTDAVWAYTHVPQRVRGDAGGSGITGRWDAADEERIVERIEERVEAHAPGFRDRIIGRHLFTPPAMEAANANLVGGDIGGGTQALHQQLIWRPAPGLAGPRTPVAGLWLASASAHPGGGVHGACGANAAVAALRDANRGPRRVVVLAVTAAAAAAAARRRTRR